MSAKSENAVDAAAIRPIDGLDLVYYNQPAQGGHFAAWEQPQIFSEEVRAGLRPLRK
jgi:hypothetical protein